MHSRSRFRWLFAALIVLIAATAFGCKNKNGPSGAASPTSSAPLPTVTPYTGKIISPTDILKKDGTATKQATLDWGSMFELSGPPEVQGFGVPTSDGVKLAVQEINDAGGFQVGDTVYKINLIERDTRSDVANTIAVAQELVQDKKVKVIFGPATLGETEATQITQQAHVLHLCPCQEREQNALSSVEKAHGDDRWAFQTLLPFSLLIGQAAENFNKEYPDLHTMALICQNSATGHDICERTKTAYAAHGVKIIGDIQYFPVGTTDYSPFLTRIKNAGEVDDLFNYDNPLNTVTIVRQALELGVGKLQLVTVPANLVRALVGRPLTVPVSAGAAPRQEVQPTTTKAADFFDRYRKFIGKDQLPPAAFVSLMTYDYVYMLAGSMQEAGTVDDTTKIAEKLETFHYNGVAEDDLFFNTRHLAVHGTEPCTVVTDPVKGDPNVIITCTHNPPPPEAYR
jgi:branched-chain amino acid transport system substrate-binding protein